MVRWQQFAAPLEDVQVAGRIAESGELREKEAEA